MATLLEKHLKLEEIKKIRNWRNEGYGLEQIKNLVDKTNITDEEIETVFNENNNGTEIEKQEDQFNNLGNSEELKEEIPNIVSEDEAIQNDEMLEETKENNFEANTIEEIDELEEIEDDDIEIIEDEAEDKDVITDNKLQENEKYEIIKDEDLEDFPDQPFKMYSESRKNTMIESIKINGIIEPIVVRKIDNNKYQILSGHNRRLCGREAGLTEFKCIVKENMPEDEARLYMVDSNLMVRDVMPTERGKALSIRKECLKNEKIASKIENEILQDNIDKQDTIQQKMVEENKMSNGNIQRYMRLNYLITQLGEMVDDKKINLKTGECLSFLSKKDQRDIVNIIEKEKVKISEAMAKKIKKFSDNGELTKEVLKRILVKEKDIKLEIRVVFYEDEIRKYFNNINNGNITAKDCKDYILALLEKQIA
ncbi:ParB N-terminal domain-containing protein [uncultured Clostridium sp.]|jgi:ParB family chromosome partitioning protein|uniref:ParB N-terminal domain-containing protein n=1 Tax=uncultured Clostridium sp. TaxID=59620 RepID=UPI00272C1AEF|nr:ParB N-terminal domain-containing protein [uncultured Clostridium sp.]